MSNKFISDVQFFHNKFGLDSKVPARPTPPDVDMIKFRLNFLLEELSELAQASGFSLSIQDDGELSFEPDSFEDEPQEVNLEDALDALVDLTYVVIGTSEFFGFGAQCMQGHTIFEEAWNRVQKANCSKVKATSADQSKRGVAFDIVKPAGWVPPTFKDLV